MTSALSGSISGFGSSISSIGSILGGIGSLFGSYGSNSNYEEQLALQKDAQNFYERMSNTAHQREVQDLISAGLNPILSATGGSGAQSGSVSMGTVANTPKQNRVERALQLLNNTAQVDFIKAQTQNMRQNTQLQENQTFHELEKVQNTIQDTYKKFSETNLNNTQKKMLEGELSLLGLRRDMMIMQVLTGYKNSATELMKANTAENTRLDNLDWTTPKNILGAVSAGSDVIDSITGGTGNIIRSLATGKIKPKK